MSFNVSIQSSFSAAHRLKGYKGRCENMHGHNWKVEVSVVAEKLDKQGMVMDFTGLKKALNRVLIQLDHKVLNDLAYFKKVNPTSENIAKYIYQRVQKTENSPPRPDISAGRGVQIKSVTVWETDTSCATYHE